MAAAAAAPARCSDRPGWTSSGTEVQVDLGRRAVGKGCLPVGQLLAGLRDDPSAQVEDYTAVLGDVDEVRGDDQTVRGVLPAQQGLHCVDGACR